MSKGSLYYFVEEDGRTRQVVNGVVTSLNKKTPLPYSPIGWQDILIKWQRNLQRWAQIRNFSLPMGFVRDAALMLRNDMFFFNIDRKLYLLIQKLVSTIDDNFFYDRYEFLYKGELDFSTFEDVPSDMRVNMNIMEGGNSKLIKANENTQFLIPFDEDAVNILMDGTFVYQNASLLVPEQTDRSGGFSGGIYNDLKIIGMTIVKKEGVAFGISLFDTQQEQVEGSFTDFMLQSSNYWAVNNFSNSTVDVRIKGTRVVFCSIKTGSVSYFEGFNRSDNTAYPVFNNIVLTEGQTYTQSFDITIPLSPGQKIFYSGFYDNSGSGTNIAELKYKEIAPYEVSYKTRGEQTIIKAFQPIQLYKKVCLKLGIPIIQSVSTILESCNILITSGDGIRGIEDADVGVKTSINDFFKAFDTYLMLGWTIRDNVIIENRESFFQTANPVELGEVSEFKTEPAKDLIFSEIKVGHKEQDIEDVNGRYDFNGHMIFTPPVKRGGREQMDLTSPYKAGPYEIESIRASLDGKGTTDDERDNQPFAIACNPASSTYNTTVSFISSGNLMVFPNDVNIAPGMRIQITGSGAGNDREYIVGEVGSIFIAKIAALDVAVTDESNVDVTIDILSGLLYSLDRSISVSSGVPDPETIFNVPLSPKRILLKHQRWIRSWLYNYEGESVIFQQANRNADLVAGGITEKSNLAVADMGELLFKPFYHEFKTRVPVDLVQIQEDTPDKPFMATWLGVNYNGFLWEAGISPNSGIPQQFKILSAPENDLTRLIV